MEEINWMEVFGRFHPTSYMLMLFPFSIFDGLVFIECSACVLRMELALCVFTEFAGFGLPIFAFFLDESKDATSGKSPSSGSRSGKSKSPTSMSQPKSENHRDPEVFLRQVGKLLAVLVNSEESEVPVSFYVAQ